MRKGYLILFVVIFSSLGAQNKGLVKKYKKEADFYFKNEDYYNALSFYNKILMEDAKNEEIHIYSLICKNKLSYPLDSLVQNEERLSVSKLADAKYCLALIKHQKKSFDESIVLLEASFKKSGKNRLVKSDEIKYMIQVNKNAKEQVANPHRAIIKNVGANINTSFPEYVPVITPDETALYFTTRRPTNIGGKKDAYGYYYEDIYVSKKDGEGWQPAENIGSTINSEGNESCVALSYDGYKMIVYKSAPSGTKGHLYITKLNENSKWEPLQLLGSEINSQYSESSACFTNDTSEIYFCSTRPGGYGGKDIYRIKKLPNGKWSLAYNLGPTINTAEDEESPFLHIDGSTFYFSSKGHNTIGEYDIYKSTYNSDNTSYTKAENLGYPINGVGNDLFFTLNVNAQKAYYSSIKEDSFGSSDIYEIDTRFSDNDLVVKNGILYKENILGKGKITLLDNETNKVTGIYNSNPKTGKFILIINPFKSYKLIVQEEGFQAIVLELEPVAYEKNESQIELKLTKK